MMNFLTHFAATCTPGSGGVLGFPTWYKYLEGVPDPSGTSKCLVQIHGITDLWLIVAAVIDMLLRVAALAAIGLIVFSGVQFITSQGDSEKTAKARNTAINAVVGLFIAVSAATVITFVAGKFKVNP